MRKFSIVTFLIVIAFGYIAASCVATSGILIEQAFADDTLCDAPCQHARRNLARAAEEFRVAPECMVGPAGDGCRADRVLLAQADTMPADSGSAIPAPPADPSQPPAPEVKPSDKLHDPLSEPLATIDDVKQAKKQGWAPAIFCVLVILTATFARASSRWPKSKLFAWFAKKKLAIIVIGGVGTVAAACFNVAALGGTWTSILFAGGGAVLALISPTHTEPAK